MKMQKHIPYVSTVVMSIIFLISSQAIFADNTKNNDFVHGIILKVDGKSYYMAGAPDGPNGELDIPGHYWTVSDDIIIGKHFNTGPFGTPQWWSSSKEDGALLYTVIGKIDNWSMVEAAAYFNKGFVHYHELVSVKDGTHHPTKVVWLRHAATDSFILDGGPHPELSHDVSPGIDYLFIPNWQMPYAP